MVVRSGVRTADNHDCEAGCRGRGRMVDAVIVDRRLEKVGIVFQPTKPVSIMPIVQSFPMG